MDKKETTPVMAGIVVGLLMVVYTLLLYLTGWYLIQFTQYVGSLIMFVGIVYCIRNHGKEKEYNATFGNLFAFGFKMTAVITCILILYTFLSGFIFPDVKTKIIEMARENALKQPNANESQVELGMEMFAKNYTIFIIMGLLFWNLVVGSITSLIGAAITKKKPKNNFQDL
ncbi:MAG: DUF4199 domain-containing protein [Flavitalea sp.]